MLSVQTCRAEQYISLCVLLNHLRMADHPAPRDADCILPNTSFFSSPGGGIHGGLLTGNLARRCHLCKPDLEKREVAITPSLRFVWLDSSRASLCAVAELVAASTGCNVFSDPLNLWSVLSLSRKLLLLLPRSHLPQNAFLPFKTNQPR